MAPTPNAELLKVEGAIQPQAPVQASEPIRVHSQTSTYAPTYAGGGYSSNPFSMGVSVPRQRIPSLISFPVKHQRKEEGVILPTGSYVKGKIMSGVEAPDGKTYPALMTLDYAFVGPNKTKIDLSGCFMIAKSETSMATERMNFQTTKLSCVSKSGKFFERDINGFVADDGDNTFAVKGEVNSKQDQVAKFAFIKSVVDGIGEIITRKAQNAGGANPDAPDVLVQQGAQGAAEKVSDWYLKQVSSILPTLKVKSGADVWVIMQESVTLPNDFFRSNERNKANGQVYSYISRVVE